MEIQNAVNLQLRVVARNTNLTRHIQRNFFEAVLLNDLVNKGHHKVKAGCKAGVVFAQALDHPGVLLGDHFHGFDDEQNGNGQNNDCDFHEVS